MPELDKLPLGVMPRHIWLKHRARDLLRAIDEYTEANKIDECTIMWMEELTKIMNELNIRQLYSKDLKQLDEDLAMATGDTRC